MPTLTLDMIDLASITEAAEYLGVTRQAIFIAIKEGRLPAMRIGRQWVIRRIELEKYRVSELRREAGLKHRPRKGERT